MLLLRGVGADKDARGVHIMPIRTLMRAWAMAYSSSSLDIDPRCLDSIDANDRLTVEYP